MAGDRGGPERSSGAGPDPTGLARYEGQLMVYPESRTGHAGSRMAGAIRSAGLRLAPGAVVAPRRGDWAPGPVATQPRLPSRRSPHLAGARGHAPLSEPGMFSGPIRVLASWSHSTGWGRGWPTCWASRPCGWT